MRYRMEQGELFLADADADADADVGVAGRGSDLAAATVSICGRLSLRWC